MVSMSDELIFPEHNCNCCLFKEDGWLDLANLKDKQS